MGQNHRTPKRDGSILPWPTSVCKTCRKSSKTMHLTLKHMLESQTFSDKTCRIPLDVLGKIMVSCKCGHHCYCSWGITDTIGTIRNPLVWARQIARPALQIKLVTSTMKPSNFGDMPIYIYVMSSISIAPLAHFFPFTVNLSAS